MERRMQSGFSLPALIVALAIIASLAAAAGETLRARMAIARAENAAQRAEQALRFARHAALLRGARVAVCLEDGADACAAERGTGLRVHAASGAQTLLQRMRLENAAGSLRLRGAFGGRKLLFAADGRAALGGSIFYCPARADPALVRRISVSAGGRIQIRPADADACH